jgi:hypothetical protein
MVVLRHALRRRRSPYLQKRLLCFWFASPHSSSILSALLAACASVRSCTLPAQQVAASAHPQAHSNGQHWHITDQAMTCQQRARNICPPAVLSAFNKSFLSHKYAQSIASLDPLSMHPLSLSALQKNGVVGGSAAKAFFVPGRVEVLGKHTDYAGGRSLLMAVSKAFCV